MAISDADTAVRTEVRTLDRPQPERWLRHAYPALAGLALALCYAGLAQLIDYLTSLGNPATATASFWPAAGLTFVTLLIAPRRYWPWLMAGVWTAEIILDMHGGNPFWVSAGWGLANATEPAVSAWLMVRIGLRRPNLARHEQLWRFIGCAVLLGPAVGALLAAGTMTLAWHQGLPVAWLRWWVGDGVGVLTVAPALLALADRRAARQPLKPTPVLLAVGVSAIAFGPIPIPHQDTLAFFVIPALVWLAFAGGQRAAAIGVLTVGLVSVGATAVGWGPIARASGAFNGVVSAQAFLAAVSFSAFMVAVLTDDLVGRDEVEARLRHQADHDPLTGLANRRAVFGVLDRLAREVGQDALVGVLMIDLDGFKEVNDSLGHEIGDAVLVESGRRLEGQVRADDLVARLGGDEFFVLLDQPGSESDIQRVAAKLEAVLREPILVGGHAVCIGASIGIATSPGSAFDAERLMRQADERMYALKRSRI